MAKDEDWMSMTEAIDHVVKVTGVSRTKARREIIAKIKDDKVRIKRVWEDAPPKALLPDEAVRRFDEDPSSIHVTLAEFKNRAAFTDDELLGELRSGRLVASAPKGAVDKARFTGRARATDFTIDYQALINWETNPETPDYLIEKFHACTRPKQ
jgi:hypothetical protein